MCFIVFDCVEVDKLLQPIFDDSSVVLFTIIIFPHIFVKEERKSERERKRLEKVSTERRK